MRNCFWVIIKIQSFHLPGRRIPWFRRDPPDYSWVLFLRVRFEMGNGLICMPKKDGGDIVGPRSRRSQRRMSAEEELLHRQAFSMAIHQHQLSQRFDGSMSRRIGSTSSRRRTLSDPLSNGKQVRMNCFTFANACVWMSPNCDLCEYLFVNWWLG